jgi:benzodiazapine receptor
MTNSFYWYSKLKKPKWAPPNWLFGPAWTILYLFIAFSFGSVIFNTVVGKLPLFAMVPFLFNLVFNFLFTPLQFGLRNNLLAAIDILLLLVSLVWMFITIFPFMRWVVYINVPYFLWVSFATTLQFTITYLNRK